MFSKWTQTNESATWVNDTRSAKFARIVFAHRTFAILSHESLNIKIKQLFIVDRSRFVHFFKIVGYLQKCLLNTDTKKKQFHKKIYKILHTIQFTYYGYCSCKNQNRYFVQHHILQNVLNYYNLRYNKRSFMGRETSLYEPLIKL